VNTNDPKKIIGVFIGRECEQKSKNIIIRIEMRKLSRVERIEAG
jgi:hypothetical protein